MADRKSKSGIIRDALILFVITLIAAILLGFVNEITREPIADQQAKAKEKAFQKVFTSAAGFDGGNQEINELITTSPEFLQVSGYEKITIDEAAVAMSSSGQAIGYVVKVTTAAGYSGDLTIVMGYQADGTMTAFEILKISETPGLGMKAKEKEFKNQYNGKIVDHFAVTKNGAVSENEINAISGATKTSRAVTEAVNAGMDFARELQAKGLGGIQNE